MPDGVPSTRSQNMKSMLRGARKGDSLGRRWEAHFLCHPNHPKIYDTGLWIWIASDACHVGLCTDAGRGACQGQEDCETSKSGGTCAGEQRCPSPHCFAPCCEWFVPLASSCLCIDEGRGPQASESEASQFMNVRPDCRKNLLQMPQPQGSNLCTASSSL